MKKIILLYSLLLNLNCSKDQININDDLLDVYTKNGVLIYKYNEKVFSGKIIDKDLNGKIIKIQSVNDGLLNGNSIEYFENGKLKEIAIFQNGRLDQTRILFHKNGLISEFINYNDGVLNGSYF